MTLADIFVALVGLFQLAASASYALKKQWIPALIWLGAACISFSTLTLTLQGRGR